MSVLEIIFGVLMLIVSLVIIVVTMMQSPKQQDMSAISGSAGNGFNKTGGTTKEESLNALTRILAVVMFILTLVANVISIVNT